MTDPQPADPAKATPPAEWKPEPRQWTWKDLFTAPMLAFKPKCMLVSAATLLVVGGLAYLLQLVAGKVGEGWYWPVYAVFALLILAAFGVGGTLVAVFMKADLLDDEFLSLGEALGRFKGRALAAVAVPVFLAVLLVGVHALMVWLPMFVASIPYAGSLLYGLLYPLGFAAAIFAILLAIAVGFSLFVFPAIVAIRQHGWFDNVVDTIEAVGTRPHILVGSLVLTGLFLFATWFVTSNAANYLYGAAGSVPTWGAESHRPEPARTEDRSREISERALRWVDPRNAVTILAHGHVDYEYGQRTVIGIPFIGSLSPYSPPIRDENDGFYRWGPGLIGGFWQTVIGALVLGYCLNLFIGGGMLTYLVVREDDYWDDEDLEDLDKLAKELEEEAKREEAGQAPAKPAETKPAETPKPPSGEVPKAEAPPAQPGPADGTLPTQIIPPKG